MQIKYPVRTGIAKAMNPKLPKITEPAKKENKSAYSYYNRGINEFLGFKSK